MPSRSRPRGIVIPCSVNAASETSWASVRPRPLSLRAWTAGAPVASARSHAAKNPGSITESASSISTASHSSAARVLEPRLARGGATRRLVLAALEDGGAEAAGDLRGRVRAAIGDDEHTVPGAAGPP